MPLADILAVDFRIKAVTFDSVPWVVTMKKNEHYFPTVEWSKDSSEECGWRRMTYEDGQAVRGEPSEGVPPMVEDNGDVGENGGAPTTDEAQA